MGLLSKREVIEQQLSFAASPTTLFNTFTNPANGKALFGAKEFEITKGRPGDSGSMTVLATFDTAPMVKHLPMLAISDEVATQLVISFGQNPPRILSNASYGTFRQQSQIVFEPEGKGTLMRFETAYEVPLAMRPFASGIRNLFRENVSGAFRALAQLAGDAKALAALKQRPGAAPA